MRNVTFPVYLHLGSLAIHPHALMEVIGYSGGFQLYLFTRKWFPRSVASGEPVVWVIFGALCGALLGSRLLAILETPSSLHLPVVQLLFAGKTVVGGLLGGWIGVEVAKRLVGVRHSTGDAFVFPLIFGQCCGRVGCFLTGLSDHTYGNFSSLPFAVDFGDGPRHPTQLYEIVFLLLLAGGLFLVRHRGARNGVLFRLYLLGYLLFRVAVEFIKPVERHYLGLSAIQLASLVGAIVLAWQLLMWHDDPAEKDQTRAAIPGN